MAGQYATLGVLAPHKHIERPYSIVSSPYESDLEFFLELVPRGELTPALHALQVGDEITIRKAAKGRFTLAPDVATHQNHLLLCTVTGVAPFVSYIRTLSTEGRQSKSPDGRRLFLLEGASRSSEFGYIDELKRIASEVPWLKYVPTVSRPWEDPGWTGEVGPRRRRHSRIHARLGSDARDHFGLCLRPSENDRECLPESWRAAGGRRKA